MAKAQQAKTGEGGRGGKRPSMSNSPVSAAQKVGRKSDGTFAKGNNYGKNDGGRPAKAYSFRELAKIRLQEIADDKKRTKLEVVFDRLYHEASLGDVNAIDKLIKLNGNYDPTETKDVTPMVRERPFKGLTVEQISKFLGETK